MTTVRDIDNLFGKVSPKELSEAFGDVRLNNVTFGYTED